MLAPSRLSQPTQGQQNIMKTNVWVVVVFELCLSCASCAAVAARISDKVSSLPRTG